ARTTNAVRGSAWSSYVFAYVLAGGVDSNGIFGPGGLQSVGSGGIASGTTISGAAQFVQSGGSAVNVTVVAQGATIVSSGGTAIGITLSGGGDEFVSGGSDLSGTVGEVGRQDVGTRFTCRTHISCSAIIEG